MLAPCTRRSTSTSSTTATVTERSVMRRYQSAQSAIAERLVERSDLVEHGPTCKQRTREWSHHCGLLRDLTVDDIAGEAEHSAGFRVLEQRDLPFELGRRPKVVGIQERDEGLRARPTLPRLRAEPTPP